MNISGKRAYLFIVAAQTGLLAVSAWVHHRYQKTAVHQAVEEQAWSDLESCATRTRAVLGELEGAESVAAGGGDERVQRLLDALVPFQGYVTVVDSEWRVIGHRGDPSQPVSDRLRPGARAVWKPSVSDSAADSAPRRGYLAMPNGLHMAAACPLPTLNYKVVFHHPVAHGEALAAALVKSFPLLGVLTLAWTVVLLGMVVCMIWSRFYASVERERTQSAEEAMCQTQDLIRTRDAVIFGLAKLADSRDPETGEHLERIAAYSTLLASALRRQPKFEAQVTPAFIRLIGISSALHDIGKVGIEDHILRKPGALTPAERARMQDHAAIGGDCLKEIEQRLGSSNFLHLARMIAMSHHERWDGTGYPRGLAGNAIPLAARIVAVADVYDALASKRVYKDPLPHDRCVAIITEGAGTQFDPDVIEVWLGIAPRFHEIFLRYSRAAQRVPESVPGTGGAGHERGGAAGEKTIAMANAGR